MEIQTTTPLIYEAILNVMKEIEPIAKERTNEFYKFKYRGIEDVYKAIQPLFAKHGVFSVPKVLDISREERPTKTGNNLYSVLTIQYTFYAKDGTSIEVQVLGEAMDSGDKSINKAMSVGHKYALFQLFCIPTDEMLDPDADGYSLTNQSNNKQGRSNGKGNSRIAPKNTYVTQGQVTFIKKLAKEMGYQTEEEIINKVNEWLAKGSHKSIKNLEELFQDLANSLIKNLVKAKEQKKIEQPGPTVQEENTHA